MPKYYAWSNFALDVDEYGRAGKKITPGEEVNPTKLKMEKEEFDELVEIGVIRADEYPDIPDHVSPAEHERAEIVRSAIIEDAEARASITAVEVGPAVPTQSVEPVTPGE